MSIPIRDHSVTQQNMWYPPTNLSLWMALFGLECDIVVRAESKVTAFAPERRQIPTVFALGTTGPFQVEPNPKSNAGTKLGTDLSQLAGFFGTGASAFGLTLWRNRRERRVGVSMDSFEAKRSRLDLMGHSAVQGSHLGTATDMVSLMTWISSPSSLG